MSDILIGLSIAVILFVVSLLVFAGGKASDASNCRDFGKFQNSGVIYECHPIEERK